MHEIRLEPRAAHGGRRMFLRALRRSVSDCVNQPMPRTVAANFIKQQVGVDVRDAIDSEPGFRNKPPEIVHPHLAA
jgi:hypothetical protein